jgi:hypothetical protein
MAQVYYREKPEGEWIQYRCLLSGRKELDSYEANHKGRALILSGAAVEVRVMDGLNPVAAWEFNTTTRGPVQLFGPDL